MITQEWIARWFHTSFDMTFGNRAFEDAPIDNQEHWMAVAQDFMADLKKEYEL